MTPYDRILALLDGVRWQDAPDVHPIRPIGHERINFFPAQRGFCGDLFPVGGIMLIANKFSNLKDWLKYQVDLKYCDQSATWRNLDNHILPEAKVDLTECWFTNYNWGVMKSDDPMYTFQQLLKRPLAFNAFLKQR